MGGITHLIAYVDLHGPLQLVGAVVVKVSVVGYIIRVITVHAVGLSEDDSDRSAVVAEAAFIAFHVGALHVGITVDAVGDHHRITGNSRVAVGVGLGHVAVVGLVFGGGQLLLGGTVGAYIQRRLFIEIEQFRVGQLPHGKGRCGTIVVPGREADQGVVIVLVFVLVQAQAAQQIPQFHAFVSVHVPIGGVGQTVFGTVAQAAFFRLSIFIQFHHGFQFGYGQVYLTTQCGAGEGNYELGVLRVVVGLVRGFGMLIAGRLAHIFHIDIGHGAEFSGKVLRGRGGIDQTQSAVVVIQFFYIAGLIVVDEGSGRFAAFAAGTIGQQYRGAVFVCLQQLVVGDHGHRLTPAVLEHHLDVGRLVGHFHAGVDLAVQDGEDGHALIDLAHFAAAFVVAVGAAVDVGIGGALQIRDHDRRGGGDAGALHGEGSAGDGVGGVDVFLISAFIGDVFKGAVGIIHAGDYRIHAAYYRFLAAKSVAGNALPFAVGILAFSGQHHHMLRRSYIFDRILQLAAVGQIEGDDLLRIQFRHDQFAGGLIHGGQQVEQAVYGHAAVGITVESIGYTGQTQQLRPGKLLTENSGDAGQGLSHADRIQLLDEG